MPHHITQHVRYFLQKSISSIKDWLYRKDSFKGLLHLSIEAFHYKAMWHVLKGIPHHFPESVSVSLSEIQVSFFCLPGRFVPKNKDSARMSHWIGIQRLSWNWKPAKLGRLFLFGCPSHLCCTQMAVCPKPYRVNKVHKEMKEPIWTGGKVEGVLPLYQKNSHFELNFLLFRVNEL